MSDAQVEPATIRREDAAKALGVSEATVDRWRKSGVLVDVPRPERGPGQPVVREVWVYREHVDQIIMARSAGATQ